MFTHQQVVDNYTFQRKDLTTDITVVIKDEPIDGIIEQFANFMKACGHYEVSVYETMKDLADGYLQHEEKRMQAAALRKSVVD